MKVYVRVNVNVFEFEFELYCSSALPVLNAVAHVMINVWMCLKIQFVIVARTYTTQCTGTRTRTHLNTYKLLLNGQYYLDSFTHTIETRKHTTSHRQRARDALRTRLVMRLTLMTTCVCVSKFFFNHTIKIIT